MIKLRDSDYNNLNPEFTECERKLIVKVVSLLAGFNDVNDVIVIVGKRKPNGRTATTAIIGAKHTFQGQVAEKLLAGIPSNWKDDLTKEKT